MAEQRCEMCFKVKVLTAVQPGMAVQVCKGCFYEIDRVVGFLEMAAGHATGVQATMDDLGSEVPENSAIAPQTPQESTETPSNGARPPRTRKKA